MTQRWTQVRPEVSGFYWLDDGLGVEPALVERGKDGRYYVARFRQSIELDVRATIFDNVYWQGPIKPRPVSHADANSDDDRARRRRIDAVAGAIPGYARQTW